QSTLHDALPPELWEIDQVSPYDEVINRFHTTTGSYHNRKYPGELPSRPFYRRGPPLWTIHSIKEFSDKLKERQWRRPLTMGHQKSESHDKFDGRHHVFTGTNFRSGPQPFVLANHHINGPSKLLVPSTENTKLAGKLYYVRDRDVLNLNNIYLSTTNKDFRAFRKEELEGYPKKDIVTYWQAEDYPKAWGHGLQENPLPKEAQRIIRDPTPMRNQRWFPSATKIPRLPHRAAPVPYTGMRTLKQESYQWPADVKQTQERFCPLEAPWVIPREGPVPEIMAVPKMYETDYQNYGNHRPSMV
uniref:Stabilizer of axonemal microtubules 3 n=2 Tax=Latimeria chalumnae TaxID=7897 RepID=H3BET3_LATCH